MAVIRKLTTFDLLLKHCDCGHTTIHGFHQQVTWTPCDDGMYFVSKCEKCGHEDQVVYIPHGMACLNGAGI